MATAESVKSKIQGLIDTANETTGGSDTDLTAAIATLIAGFGKGSDEGGVQVYAKSVTAPAAKEGTRVSVDFGFSPDFLLVVQSVAVTLATSKAYTIIDFGFSKAAKTALGLSDGVYFMSTSGAKNTSKLWSFTESIEDTTSYLQSADETGFTIGVNPFYSTALFVVAMKLF